jgi:hypothetical protein
MSDEERAGFRQALSLDPSLVGEYAHYLDR